MDENFWKDAYKDSWAKASDKENWVKSSIEKAASIPVEIVGLGAGSTDYISGSAASNDKEKGGADLYLPSLDIYVEVTGPNIKVSESDTLWVRPDKIASALRKIDEGIGTMHLVVHMAELRPNGQKLARVIFIEKRIKDAIADGTIELINPRIRGNIEQYYAIPANYVLVRPYENFLQFLRSASLPI